MSNIYGNRNKCIFLEFNRLVGTDAIFYPDGRHSNHTVENEIIEYVQTLRKRDKSLILVGFQHKNSSGHGIFPSYVTYNANR